ncbi:MAG TPA: hypothetical protein VGE52_02765 [Pirellulales bacterium]
MIQFLGFLLGVGLGSLVAAGLKWAGMPIPSEAQMVGCFLFGLVGFSYGSLFGERKRYGKLLAKLPRGSVLHDKVDAAEFRMAAVFFFLIGAAVQAAKAPLPGLIAASVLAILVGGLIGYDFKRRVCRIRREVEAERDAVDDSRPIPTDESH